MPKRPFSIAPDVTALYCAECAELRAVSDVIETEDCDVAVQACGHQRSVYVPVAAGRLSVEHVGSPEGAGLFPGDAKHFPITGSIQDRWKLRGKHDRTI
jgi:hypothetical protein